MTVAISAQPTGPPEPPGGWTCVMGDGFDASDPLGQTDSIFAANRNNNASDGGLVADCGGFNSNEVEVFNASQVSVQADGVHLTLSHSPRTPEPLTVTTTLSGGGLPLSTSVATTSLPVAALIGPMSTGDVITTVSGAHTDTWTLAAPAATAAASITVASRTASFAYPSGSNVYGPIHYVSGCLSSQPLTGAWTGGQAGFDITGFSWLPTVDVIHCFEIVVTLPSTTLPGGDMGWWATSPEGKNEVDFQEWANYVGGITPPPFQWQTIAAFTDHTTSTSNGGDAFNPAQQQDGAQHVWTTVFDGTTLTVETYVDGVHVPALDYNWIAAWEASYMPLVLSHAIRNAYANQIPSLAGSADVIVRSVACYQDTVHAGVGIAGGGFAPGTLNPAPVTCGSLALERFAPWLTPTADPNGDYATFLTAVSAMAEPLFSLVWDQGDPDDADYMPGWGSLFSLSACKFAYLPFLAQLTGTDPNALIGASDSMARSIIGQEQGQSRGTAPAIVAAAQRWLSGTQAVTLFERTAADGSTADPYHFVIVVLTAQVINLASLQNAVDAVRPGGVLWTLLSTTTWTIAQFELAEALVSNAEADFASVVHLETDVSP